MRQELDTSFGLEKQDESVTGMRILQCALLDLIGFDCSCKPWSLVAWRGSGPPQLPGTTPRILRMWPCR